MLVALRDALGSVGRSDELLAALGDEDELGRLQAEFGLAEGLDAPHQN